ncbi:MAG: ATP-binding protein, partial [Nitrospira sp.]|nr:ATP-binding protein [Nitrospira sp.]
MSRKPSDGERSARIGYEAQDKRAANLIYEFLVEGRLDWFKIADPNAGRVDDIQVATTDGEIHAFQVKWAETTQYISFAEVTHSTSTVPSLIAQLADGWRLLKSQNPEMNIHVHLIHRHIPHPKSALANSKIDLPLDDPPPLQPSFQGFIRDCWEEKEHWLPLGLSSIPQGWRGAIEATRKEVNPSTDKDFLEFLSACHLHFNYQFPKPEYPNNPRAIRREKDVDDIARLIAKLGGGGDRRVIEITRDKLLQNLGWGSRFEFRYKHDFPVDETLYQPITQTVVELESAITQFNSGYLALLGTPGSGKSTTLIHTLRYRQGLRLIRYYAYVPNSPLQEGRGEAQSFLHDLHLALQRQGIFSPKSVVAQPQSLEELREDFLAQLGILHEKWCEDGIRTLIVVDGLDHIEREQFPSRSLIKELFMPESIPEGVLIILGSQTLDLKDFSQRIRNHLRESGRTLTLEALTRQAVFNIIKAFALPVSLNTDQMEKINTLSNGHPLALSYLLANLRNAADENSLIDILDGTEPYQSHITDNYEIYWNKLEQDEDLKDLFALLSRLRGPFNPKKLIQWAGESTTKRFITQARHYFQEESDTRWQFFHNSFRQFILSQTRRNIFGEQDPEKDKNYHQHLAKLAAADSDIGWSWEEIFHRFCAGEWDKVLQIGTQEYFRNQFLTLRSLEAILEDTGLCLKAARIKRDGIALIRCFLIEKELGDRHQTLDISHIDLPRILYEVHGMDVALKYVIDGQQVLLGKKEAIEFVSLLIEKGQLQAAEKVFNVAEPLDLLSGSTFLESYEKENWGIVHAWAKVACYFRPLEKLFSVIEQLRTNPQSDWEGQRPQDLEHALKEDVVMTLTHCVFDSGNHDILNKFKDLLHSRENGQLFLRELDFLTCRSHKNHATSNPALERLLRWEEEGFIRELTKLQLAEFTIRIRGDRETTDKLVSGISQPSLCESKVGNWSWDDLEPFSFRIRFNRLLAMLGNPADPKQAVLDAEPSKRGGVLFERSLVLIANLWGKAWAEQTLSPFLVLQELKPVLNLFYKDSKETQDWTCWYSYRQIAPEFFGFLIHAVAEHGPEVIKELGEEFDRRWEADPKYWPT